MPFIGSKVFMKYEALMKLIENYVCAVDKLEALIPVESNNALKAEVDASVVKFTEGIW